jgi:TolB protein
MRAKPRPLFALLTLAVLVFAATGAPARAELQIDITRGYVQPLPIAITDFLGGSERDSTVGRDIAQVISANLERSGLFRPVDPKSFIQSPESVNQSVRFADWRLINAQALVTGTAQLQQDGRLRVEFRLWDIFAEQQMTGLAYHTTPSNWRRVAHIISDAIYKRLTGEDGYFDSRIVYVAETGPQDRRIKRLAIMDQDGANYRVLTDGSALVLTPRFSPSTQEITYLSYSSKSPRVYLYNLDTGQQEVIGDFPGMTFAPRFSPDGNRVIMTLAQEGNSDIYTMDLRTRQLTRLTRHSGIDTAPSYSPDGTQVVFESNRGGSQQLYVMDANGNNVHRISFGKGRYATPVWSPRGDLIVFTRISEGEFFIGVMRPDGSGERMLTRGFLVEGPTWAPNGRVIAFYRKERTDSSGRGGQTRLFTIDLTGHNERELVTPTDASDPAWSPLIP